jgi:hypothetical protein
MYNFFLCNEICEKKNQHNEKWNVLIAIPPRQSGNVNNVYSIIVWTTSMKNCVIIAKKKINQKNIY